MSRSPESAARILVKEIVRPNTEAAPAIDVLALDILGTATVANVGRSTVYDWIRNGDLRARKAGRKTLVLVADLKAFLESLPDFEHHKTELVANKKRRARSPLSGAEVAA